MIFRWKCNKCETEIENGTKRFKVIQLNPYKHVGDLCFECWNGLDTKTKGELNPVKDQGNASNSEEDEFSPPGSEEFGGNR